MLLGALVFLLAWGALTAVALVAIQSLSRWP